MLHRVKVWEHLAKLNDSSDQWERSIRAFCHWLLELDSKCNLHSLTPPTDFFSRFFDCLTLDQFEQLTKDFELVAVPKIIEADKAFAIGNRLSSSAYIKSWFDNPELAQRKVEIANPRRQRLFNKYGSVELGLLIEEEKRDKKKILEAEKKVKDARIITGRSARSKAAQLVNKHADKLNAAFKILSDTIESNSSSKAPTPVVEPARKVANGLPKFVKG
jgi:hypothetical protein